MKRLFRILGFGRGATRAEVDEEIRAHIEERITDLESSGMSHEEARAEAHRRFGDLDAARRRLYRSARRRNRRLEASDRFAAVLADLRLAARRARTQPGHTLLTIAIFAIGVGLSTLTFGLVDQILLRPLPFPDSERLVRLESMQEARNTFPWVSATNWWDWRQSDVVASTGIHREHQVTARLADRAVRLTVTGVAGSFFETLRPGLLQGRVFTEEETDRMLPVAMVSRSFWETRLGAPTPLDGVTLELDGTDFDVVGVVRDGHTYPSGSSVWIPTPYRVLSGGARNNINFESVARLAPRVTIEQARLELQSVADRIRREAPEAVYSWGVGVTPLDEAVSGPVNEELELLLWSSLVVLIVGCINLAGLALAAGQRRGREMAVRTALGARRGRLVRQLLSEHLLLGVVGGALGIALSWMGTDIVATLLGAQLPRAAELAVDWRIAAIGVAVALLAVLVAGLAPALRISDADPAGQLAGKGGSERQGASLPGAGLVVAEIVLAVTLLTGAGLLVRSMMELVSRDLGFEPAAVAAAQVRLHADDVGANRRYWDEALAAAEAIPGARAALATAVPLGLAGGGSFITVEGVDADRPGARYTAISDDYFVVMGIPLLEGRGFGPGDDAGSERVVIVDEGLAVRYWPDGSAIGRRIRADSFEAWFNDGTAPWLRIVGVVGSVRTAGFEDAARDHMYVLYRQLPHNLEAMAVLARGASAPPVRELQETLAPIDRSVAVETRAVSAWVSESLGERRLMISLLGTFSLLTLGLAALGLYGLIAHSVSRRRREMALRAALGANRSTIRSLVLRQGLTVVTVGLLIGVMVSLWSSTFIEQFLVDVSTYDPVTRLGVAGTLLVIGVLAVLVPAIRATRAHPAEVLRE